MSIRIFHFSRTPVKEEDKDEDPVSGETIAPDNIERVESFEPILINFKEEEVIITSDDETTPNKNTTASLPQTVYRSRKYGPRQKRPKVLTCTWCKKRFTHKGHYDVHLRIHTGEKPFACEFCDKRFRHSNIWRMHQRMHTGEKPFQCAICHLTFSRRSYLKHHGLMHLGHRPYHCNQCNESFFRFAECREHSRTAHTPVKKLPYICVFCGRRFRKNSLLDRHVKFHTGDRPYACGICDKRFIQKSHLNNHLDTHKL